MRVTDDPIHKRERRRDRRSATESPAEINTGSSEPVTATLCDVSPGGALILVDRPVSVQEQCDIRFALDGEEDTGHISATGTVVRCEVDREMDNAVRAAVKFTKISDEHQSQIRQFGQTLFRPEALAARNVSKVGNVVLTHPPLFGRLTVAVALFGLALVALFIFGSYARRNTVIGQLVPDTGLIKVQAQHAAVVSARRVKEGQTVRRGDVLYTLSAERHGSEGGIEAMMSARAEKRRKSLQDEVEKTRALQAEEGVGLEKRIAGMRAELAALEQQTKNQQVRLGMAEDIARRYKALLEQDYVSHEQVQQKREEMLEQSTRLYDLSRSKAGLKRELDMLENELNGLKHRHDNQLAAIERSLTEAEQELTESEARRQTVIVAPEDGIVATAHVESGQAVSQGTVLASIVPLNSKLEAQLYAPSRTIASVKPGSKVRIRYQSYPFQKFGAHEGVVTSVARTALPLSEFMTPVDAGRQLDEPVYRIKVQLPSQTMTVRGGSQPLQSGMQIEADIMQHRQYLYEWIFEPLAALAGRL